MNKKEELPAMPFYWGDWFKSPDVQSLPLDTRCVWFEMIGRMWESNERGYLTINGKPMPDFAKARSLGFGTDIPSYLEHEKILEELGLFSRRSDGAIYSRKILHINDLREKRRLAGSLGGKQKASKSLANSLAITENENEIVNEKETIKEHFNLIWEKYPNKDGKKAAERYFTASVKTEEDLKNINKALDKYLIHLKANDWKRRKNGSTWFNNWQDWVNWVEPEATEHQKKEFQQQPKMTLASKEYKHFNEI